MTTQRIYALPVDVTQWTFDGATDLQFNWEYDDGSAPLLELYEKGKQQQWTPAPAWTGLSNSIPTIRWS